MRRWSSGILPKVNKLVGIEDVRLRNCGLGRNAKLPGKGVFSPIVQVPFQNFDVVWVICNFGVVPNGALIVRSCSWLVLCTS